MLIERLGEILADIIRAAHGGSDVANNLVTRIDEWVKDAKAEQTPETTEPEPEPVKEPETPSE